MRKLLGYCCSNAAPSIEEFRLLFREATSRKVSGYAAYCASIVLHRFAVGELVPPKAAELPIWESGWSVDYPLIQFDALGDDEWDILQLEDVAPRLAAACETVCGHVGRVRRRIGL